MLQEKQAPSGLSNWIHVLDYENWTRVYVVVTADIFSWLYCKWNLIDSKSYHVDTTDKRWTQKCESNGYEDSSTLKLKFEFFRGYLNPPAFWEGTWILVPYLLLTLIKQKTKIIQPGGFVGALLTPILGSVLSKLFQ